MSRSIAHPERGTPKGGCDEQLVLWAIRQNDADRRFVHIGLLGSDDRGAACNCICRACGEQLIAINVDKSASHFERPGTQRRHFKHRHTSAGQTRCNSKLARLIAMQLYLEQGVVHLPPRTLKASKRLANGHEIRNERTIEAEEVAVRSKEWIDDEQAILVLDDGRELLVTVRARLTVDDKARADCVLSLAGVTDPAIATWDKDQILNHLKLPGSGMTWDRHWQDDELAGSDDLELAKSEDLLLGGIPREYLEGLEGKQYNETILHWLIKKAVLQSGELNVPEERIGVRQTMPDGSVAELTAICPAVLLMLDNIRLERRLGTVIPDVICLARRADGQGKGFELMLEAAVTHNIDAAKLEKIKELGVACIEIRADLFTQAGNVPAADIERMVCSDSTVKRWIVHPWIGVEINKARRQLQMQHDAMQRAMDQEEQRREDERVRLEYENNKQAEEQARHMRWIATANDRKLYTAYLRVLKASWNGENTYRSGKNAGIEDAIWSEMVARKLVDGRKEALESHHGLLRLLVRIQDNWATVRDQALARLSSMVHNRNESPHEAAVLMFVLQKHQGDMQPFQAEEFQELCAELRRKVLQEDARFQRRVENDRLLAALFPALKADLASDFATAGHFTKLGTERTQKAEATARRNRRIEKVEVGRRAQIAAKKAAEINSAIERANEGLAWCEFPFGDPEPVKLYWSYNRSARMLSMDTLELFKTVERHRRQRSPISVALHALRYSDASEVERVVQLMTTAGLCVQLKASA